DLSPSGDRDHPPRLDIDRLGRIRLVLLAERMLVDREPSDSLVAARHDPSDEIFDLPLCHAKESSDLRRRSGPSAIQRPKGAHNHLLIRSELWKRRRNGFAAGSFEEVGTPRSLGLGHAWSVSGDFLRD